MSYFPFNVKSVQYGSITLSGDGSDSGTSIVNQAISAVNVASSIIDCLGFVTNLNGDDAGNTAAVELTSSTNVRATVYNSVGQPIITIFFKVTEYYPQYVKSRQTGTASIVNSNSSQNTEVSAVVVVKSILSYQGQYWGTNGIGAGLTPRNWLGGIMLNSTTTVLASRGNNQGELDFPFTLLEFF